MENAIDIQALHKKYRRLEAVRGISLAIPQGEFFGLLGPNGAGKTTLIKSIVGLARPTSGTVFVFGKDVVRDSLQTKSLIGYSPQESNADRWFKVRRILEFHGGYYHLSYRERKIRAQEIMAQFGLTEKSESPFYALSGGQQKRVLIARALIPRPKILILDEPTAGVDVQQRHELWHSLKKLNQEGVTILLTTHYIEEAEELCHRVGMIHEGRIVEMGPPRTLIEKHCDPSKVQMIRGSLEEVFIKITGQSIKVDEVRGGENGRLSHTG